MNNGPHPLATILNSAFRIDPGTSARDALSVAAAHYAPDVRFGLSAANGHDDDISEAAAAAGWELAIRLPAMVRRTRLPEASDRPLPPATFLRRVDPESAADRRALGTIVAACFADDDDEIVAYVVACDPPAVVSDGCAAFLATVDGRDAACAWVGVAGGGATVGLVGTLPEYRRRGLGDLVTRAATNAGFEMGARFVSLQASPSGEPVYRAMGYETITSETIWAPPQDS